MSNLFVLETEGHFSRVMTETELKKFVESSAIGGNVYLAVLTKVGEAKVNLSWGVTGVEAQNTISEISRDEEIPPGSPVSDPPAGGSGEIGAVEREKPKRLRGRPRKSGGKKPLVLHK